MTRAAAVLALAVASCSSSEPTPKVDPVRRFDRVDFAVWRAACDAELTSMPRHLERDTDPIDEYVEWTCKTKDGLEAVLGVDATTNLIETVGVSGDPKVARSRYEEFATTVLEPVFLPQFRHYARLPLFSTDKVQSAPIDCWWIQHRAVVGVVSAMFRASRIPAGYLCPDRHALR